MSTDTTNEFLSGLAIGNYTCFGKKLQYIGPFKRINIFIGANNSGKSSLLNFLTSYIFHAVTGTYSTNQHFDYLPDKENILWGLGFVKKFTNDVPPIINLGVENPDWVNQLNWAFFERRYVSDVFPNNVLGKPYISAKSLVQSLPIEHETLQTQVVQNNGLTVNESFSTPRIIKVSAMRHINNGAVNFKNVNGDGFVKILKKWCDENTDEYRDLNQFITKIVGKTSKYVVQNRDKNDWYIDIEQDNLKPLRLSHIGTGVQESLLLAAIGLYYSGAIICLEEPELHLHPTMQRQVIDFLFKTKNQYFITTHSASIINESIQEKNWQEYVSLLHLIKRNDITEINELDGKRLFPVLSSMGYKASDLSQINSVIFVEGPSDIIYIKYWLERWVAKYIQMNPKYKDFSLEEGRHFLFARTGGNPFYGTQSGKKADPRKKKEDFLENCESLWLLNQNLAVIVDRDTFEIDNLILSKKMALEDKLNKNNAFGWVTYGKEIENYIPILTFDHACQQKHKGPYTQQKLSIQKPENRKQRTGNFTDYTTTNKKNKDMKNKDMKKNEVAIYLTEIKPFNPFEHTTDDSDTQDVLDELKGRIGNLVDFILVSNHEFELSKELSEKGLVNEKYMPGKLNGRNIP